MSKAETKNDQTSSSPEDQANDPGAGENVSERLLEDQGSDPREDENPSESLPDRIAVNPRAWKVK